MIPFFDAMAPLRGFATGYQTNEDIQTVFDERRAKERKRLLDDYQIMEQLGSNDRYAQKVKELGPAGAAANLVRTGGVNSARTGLSLLAGVDASQLGDVGRYNVYQTGRDPSGAILTPPSLTAADGADFLDANGNGRYSYFRGEAIKAGIQNKRGADLLAGREAASGAAASAGTALETAGVPPFLSATNPAAGEQSLLPTPAWLDMQQLTGVPPQAQAAAPSLLPAGNTDWRTQIRGKSTGWLNNSQYRSAMVRREEIFRQKFGRPSPEFLSGGY